MQELPELESVPAASSVEAAAPVVRMSYEEALVERMQVFALRCVQLHFARVGVATRVTRETRLGHLQLSFMDLEDVAELLGLAVGRLEKMTIVGEIVGALVADMETLNHATSLPLPQCQYAPVTVFSLEYTGQIKRQGELVACPKFALRDQQDFAQLRRSWREHGKAFQSYWMALADDAQRKMLFRAAPFPLDDSDEAFPVSKQILPGITVVNLMGPGLIRLFQQRVTSKYAVVVQAELTHARTIMQHFENTYIGKSFSFKHRRFFKDGHSALDADCIDGRLFSIFHTMICSVQRALQAIMDEFVIEKEEEKRQTAAKARFAGGNCNACGKWSLKLKVCSRCKGRKFCSAECQKQDWTTHRSQCASQGVALRLGDGS